MHCKKCGEKMKLFYNTKFIDSFGVYKCPKCNHSKEFSKDDILIAILEFVTEEC